VKASTKSRKAFVKEAMSAAADIDRSGKVYTADEVFERLSKLITRAARRKKKGDPKSRKSAAARSGRSKSRP
jgi:hypothetical protein